MTFYVLVEVTYDYHRFQENLSVNNTGKFDESLFNGTYSILDYENDSQEADELNQYEMRHYWIQKFGA